ncbi:MAG: type I glyceraldehyde-3-phosphate dehydrogenase [Thermoanaerobaculia bacterium]
MSVRIAINGLGRMGRALFRAAWPRPTVEIVAVNDLGTAEQLAGLLARDTLHGPFPGEVASAPGALLVDGRRVAVYNESDPAAVPWLGDEPEVVVDATGHCTERPLAESVLRPPVRKVVVSANAEGMDQTICMGVNHDSYDPDAHHLLSAASCTTNCLVPVVSVLDRAFGFERGMLNTVHSYNNDQRLLGYPHKDPRRARAAALNMIPTTTSAVIALGRVLPRLEGRIQGYAVRVPTPNVSLIDLVAELRDSPDAADVNRVFRQAAEDELAGILAVSEEPLVSSDFLGDSHSAIVDLPLTESLDGRLHRVVAWYDNECGHASRLADLAELVGGAL